MCIKSCMIFYQSELWTYCGTVAVLIRSPVHKQDDEIASKQFISAGNCRFLASEREKKLKSRGIESF